MHELKIKNLFTEKAIYEDILCIQTKGQKMLQKNVFPYKSQLRRKYVNHHCRSAVEFSYSQECIDKTKDILVVDTTKGLLGIKYCILWGKYESNTQLNTGILHKDPRQPRIGLLSKKN